MNNGADLGQAYRSLEAEAETLEQLLEKGKIRLSQEQINNKLAALKQMSVLKSRINKALEAFPSYRPAARKEPPADGPLEKLKIVHIKTRSILKDFLETVPEAHTRITKLKLEIGEWRFVNQ